MNGRMVTIDTAFQTVSAAQDLLETKMGSAQFGVVHSIKIIQSSDATAAEAELLQVTVSRAAGSFTSGSGGGSSTVTKRVTNDASHGLATTERNNTTQAVAGSGSLEMIMAGVLAVLAGEWEWCPTPEARMILLASEACVVALSAPADALTLRCIMELEIFG